MSVFIGYRYDTSVSFPLLSLSFEPKGSGAKAAWAPSLKQFESPPLSTLLVPTVLQGWASPEMKKT